MRKGRNSRIAGLVGAGKTELVRRYSNNTVKTGEIYLNGKTFNTATVYGRFTGLALVPEERRKEGAYR